jgi:hypothetical protein
MYSAASGHNKSQWDSARGASWPCGMAVKRRGRGEDSVYFDQANGYWVGSVSLSFAPDGKRRRRTVRGRTKTKIRDALAQASRQRGRKPQPPSTRTWQRPAGPWQTPAGHERSSSRPPRQTAGSGKPSPNSPGGWPPADNELRRPHHPGPASNRSGPPNQSPSPKPSRPKLAPDKAITGIGEWITELAAHRKAFAERSPTARA